jgi:hypothetical protein
MDKLDNAGYIITGSMTRTSTEDALTKIGDRDFYKKEIK